MKALLLTNEEVGVEELRSEGILTDEHTLIPWHRIYEVYGV